MRFILSVFFSSLLLVSAAQAAPGRTGQTTITNIVVKQGVVEFYTVAGADAIGDVNCSNKKRWHLLKVHQNFEALFSGLLTAKTAGTPVDISGNGSCNGSGEIIEWAYIAY